MPCLVFKDKQGRRIEVALHKPVVTIGREPGNDVVIPFRSVSRRHCAFATRPDGVFVHDIGSSNGSTVNDLPLEGEVRLQDRDRLLIGEFRIRYYEQSKYPQNSLSMDATRSVVLFQNEVAVAGPAAPAGAPEPTAPVAGRSRLALLVAAGGGFAAGSLFTLALVLVLLGVGVLRLG